MSFSINSTASPQISPLSARSLGCSCGGCASCTARSASASTTSKNEARSGSDSFAFSGQVPDEKDSANEIAASSTATTSSAPESNDKKAQASAAGKKISEADQQVVEQLQSRDREVRAHEAAHQAAGGGAVGGASYSYQQGPDGRQYAVGGEVPVDLSSSGGSPEATIAKMARVRAAATAPAEPSGQDLAVAAAASSIEAAARQELRTKTADEKKPDDEAKKVGESDGATKPAERATEAVDEPASPTVLGEQKTAEPGKPTSSADSSNDAVTSAKVGGASASSANERAVADRAVQRALGAYRAAVAGPTASGIDQRA
jgi:hypothetical protein